MYSRVWSRIDAAGGVGRPAFVDDFGLRTDEQRAAAEQIHACLGEVDLVRLAFCDPHGLARSKTLTAEAFRSVLHNGMDFSPGPFVFDTGHAVAVDFVGEPGVGVEEILGAGDFVVVPDPLTFQVLPGTEHPRTAWVLGDEFLRDGSPHPLGSRRVLRQVCERYAARDLAPVIGLEVEWYLTRLLGGPPGNVGNGFGQQGAAPLVEAMNAGYQFNLDTYYDSVAVVTNPLSVLLAELGLPLRSLEHESGPGQIETTFDPMSALDAADAVVLFRTVVKQMCARRGFHATFMSLPRLDGFDASGWHLHQSVSDNRTGRNLFSGNGVAEGVSGEGKAYVEGLLSWARELCLLSVPTVNGYRRFAPEFSLAPSRIRWAVEDRTALVRVLGGGSSAHVENRTGEPCANPYLAMAAQLFAGLDGIAGLAGESPAAGGDLPAASGAPVAPAVGMLPLSLHESLEAFRRGRAGELLGGPLAACLTKLKESELQRFEAWRADHESPDGEVTEWEQREYFGTF